MKTVLQLKNVFLFLLALLSIFRLGNRTRVPVIPPQKVLVVQTSKLGDMVCFTPVLRALKKRFPGTEVHVVGDRVNKEVLAGNTDVDRYVVFEEQRILTTARELSKEQYDVALVRGPSLAELVLAVLTQSVCVIAPRVSGGKVLQTRTYLALLPFVRTVTYEMGKYMPRQFLFLLEPLGIYEDDTTKHLAYSDAAKESVSAMLAHRGVRKDKPLVGITLSAGNKIKEWPIERFANVADHLIKNYNATVVFIGGPGDAKYGKNVRTHMCSGGDTNVLDLTAQLSIDELKALIVHLDLLIGVDTGPIYIAEAFGVSTVDIVGPMDEREQPPTGKRHAVVVADRTEPQLHIMNARIYDKYEARRQTESILASDVVAACEEILKSVKN